MTGTIQVTGTLFDAAPPQVVTELPFDHKAYERPPKLTIEEWEEIRRIYECAEAWKLTTTGAQRGVS
jgi:hypothetical protein